MKLTSEDCELLSLLAKVLLEEEEASVEERLFSKCLTLEEASPKGPLNIRLKYAAQPPRPVVAKKPAKKPNPQKRAVSPCLKVAKRARPQRQTSIESAPPPAYTRLLGDDVQRLKKIGLEPLLEALYDALAQLPPREADILRNRYSFSKEAWTLEALGDKYGISRQRVQQLERNALKKLRKALIDKFSEK